MESCTLEASSLSPPQGFLPPQGAVTNVHLTNVIHGRGRYTPAQKAGLAYEKKVKAFLEGKFPSRLIGQWFSFFDEQMTRRFCQPDAILFTRTAIVIAEIKIRWSALAWWQLRKLYIPVVSAVYRDRLILPLCITRTYDPAIQVPEEVKLLDDIDSVSSKGFGVLLWKP